MNGKSQKAYWLIDAVLFAGLICAFFMDETGLPFHQWLGVTVGVLSNYHLITHWRWVKATASNFITKKTVRPRVYFILDALMAVGMTTTVATGLVISTWLSINLTNSAEWKAIHIILSVITLMVTLVKIGLHWKWIVKTARRFSAQPVFAAPQLATVRIPARVNSSVSRRDFLKMMGVVGTATVLASIKAIDELQGQAVTASSNPVDSSASVKSDSAQTESVTSLNIQSESAAVQPTPTLKQADTYVTNLAGGQSTISCTQPCPDKCAYPGRCRRYTDINSNGLCDNGECA